MTTHSIELLLSIILYFREKLWNTIEFFFLFLNAPKFLLCFVVPSNTCIWLKRGWPRALGEITKIRGILWIKGNLRAFWSFSINILIYDKYLSVLMGMGIPYGHTLYPLRNSKQSSDRETPIDTCFIVCKDFWRAKEYTLERVSMSLLYSSKLDCISTCFNHSLIISMVNIFK